MFSDQCVWSVALARSVCQVVIICARVRSHTKEALKGIVSCGGSLGDGVERVQLAAMKYVRMIKVPEVVVLARPCDSFKSCFPHGGYFPCLDSFSGTNVHIV